MKKKIKFTILMLMTAPIVALVVWDAYGNKLTLILERQNIEQTAERYLKAERERNLPQVYALLAPSSVYRKTHTYQDYLKDAGSSSKKISTYRIIDVYRLRDNDNRENFPQVEKFVQVEVDVTFTDTGENSIYNYCFTFLKENGLWYKG
ncbi:MAG: hypothetical protein A4E71_03295 [Smithella sp. PtaU1.Bin162]|nr:MAG: hypothetical protein A4E71_03295 [Smithella sp. PtaU1.Bin162]